MSKKNYTHIIVILDRSGSMSSIRKDMEGGFNEFIDKQKINEGEATLTLAQFDNHYDIVYSNIALSDVPSLSLQPRGGTALLDAIGKTLEDERKRIKDMSEDDYPEKVVCIVITDGEENASTQYNRETIFEMISDLEKEETPQWDFVFLGANQDAIQSGGSIGVRANSSMTYSADSIGTQAFFSSLNDSMTQYRGSKGAAFTFEKEPDKSIQTNSVQKQDTLTLGKFDKSIPTKISDL